MLTPTADPAVQGKCTAKRLATLCACAALAGYAVSRSDDDYGRPVFVIARGALCERLDSLDDVQAWLVNVGALDPVCPP